MSRHQLEAADVHDNEPTDPSDTHGDPRDSVDLNELGPAKEIAEASGAKESTDSKVSKDKDATESFMTIWGAYEVHFYKHEGKWGCVCENTFSTQRSLRAHYLGPTESKTKCQKAMRRLTTRVTKSRQIEDQYVFAKLAKRQERRLDEPSEIEVDVVVNSSEAVRMVSPPPQDHFSTPSPSPSDSRVPMLPSGHLASDTIEAALDQIQDMEEDFSKLRQEVKMLRIFVDLEFRKVRQETGIVAIQIRQELGNVRLNFAMKCRFVLRRPRTLKGVDLKRVDLKELGLNVFRLHPVVQGRYHERHNIPYSKIKCMVAVNGFSFISFEKREGRK